MKLAIGMPHTGTIKAQTVYSLLNLRPPCGVAYIFKQGSVLHLNRQLIVEEALRANCTHLLFVDSDMSFETDAATRLIERDKDIIGVHYNLRSSPPTSTVHMDKEKKKRIKELAPDGLTTCDALATGFLLINLDVFKKISRPWFFWGLDESGDTKTGEDYWFCERAKEAGYEIWVDLAIPIKHIGDYAY